MSRTSLNIVVLALSGIASSLVYGEEQSGLRFSIDNNLGYEDNYLKTQSDEKDGWVLRSSPQLAATVVNNGNLYQLSYTVERTENFDSSDDSYTDQRINFKADHQFDRRNAIELRAERAYLTEARGTGFSEGVNASLLSKPDDYDQTRYGATYRLGSSSARAGLALKVDHVDLDYDSSLVGDTRDYEYDQYGIEFKYRLGGRTDGVIEYRLRDTEYTNQPTLNLKPIGPAINLDSQEHFYLIGLDWDATAKTSGKLRLGQSERDFDDSARGADDNFHWELELAFQPKTYSRVKANFRRESFETNGAGAYINSDNYDLSWDHAWGARLSHTVELGFANDTYEGSSREDDLTYYGIKFDYDFREWLDIGFGYRFEERDSNFFGADYDRGILLFSLNLALDYNIQIF